jgi:hypothetical protein
MFLSGLLILTFLVLMHFFDAEFSLASNRSAAKRRSIGSADLALLVYLHPDMRHFEPMSGRFLQEERLAAALEEKSRVDFRAGKSQTMETKRSDPEYLNTLQQRIAGLENEISGLTNKINLLRAEMDLRYRNETRGLASRDPEREKVDARIRSRYGSQMEKLERELSNLVKRKSADREELDSMRLARAPESIYRSPAEELTAQVRIRRDIRRALEAVVKARSLSGVLNGTRLRFRGTWNIDTNPAQTQVKAQAQAQAQATSQGQNKAAANADSEAVDTAGNVHATGPFKGMGELYFRHLTENTDENGEFAMPTAKELADSFSPGLGNIISGGTAILYNDRGIEVVDITVDAARVLLDLTKAPIPYRKVVGRLLESAGKAIDWNRLLKPFVSE